MSLPYILPILLLAISNVFMTFAWYGHLKYPSAPLLAVIGISWLIAFAEYCFAVPANRIGHGVYSAAELKTIQEVLTLSIFAVFSVFYLGVSTLPVSAQGPLSLIVGEPEPAGGSGAGRFAPRRDPEIRAASRRSPRGDRRQAALPGSANWPCRR